MGKRKFYDWRYNTKSAIAERKQKVIEQSVLERRKRQALKAAESELKNLPQAISTDGTCSLQSDSLLERYESKRKLGDKPRKAAPASQTKGGIDDTTPAATTTTTTITTDTPAYADTPATTTTTTPLTFEEELAAIRKMKISKHDKGVKINLLKQKYKAKEAAERELALTKIDKSNKRRLAQTKRMQKKKKSGQLKIGGASRVLLQRIHKSFTAG